MSPSNSENSSYNTPKILTAKGRVIDENVFDNTAENHIVITESKARQLYNKYMQAPRLRDVGSLFALALTCFVAATTTHPEDFLGIDGSGDFLHAGFWFCAMFFGAATLYGLINHFRLRKSLSEEAFIEEMKGKG